MDDYRENGARGFLEIHSKGLRQLKAEREICLDVRKENLSSEGEVGTVFVFGGI